MRPALIVAAVLSAAVSLPADDPKPKPPAQPRQLRAGAAAVDVTPPAFPISVNGGFGDRKATAANDPLHARCLVLDDGTTKLAFVVVDSCMIPREIHDAAKALAARKTGIPAGNILISATHTHTAPTVAGVFQSEPDAAYAKYLTGKIADAVTAAHAKRAAAKAGWGSAPEPGHVFNRRWKTKPGTMNADPFGTTTDAVKTNPGYQNPNLLEQAGGVDPDVWVLSLRTPDGKPLALLANYGLHYVGDLPPLSADYFGVFADLIGRKLGATDPAFVGVLSNGTSGDVNNVDFRGTAPKLGKGERSRLVADAVANAAKKAADAAAYSGAVTLAAAETEIELKVRKPSGEELKRAALLLDKAKGRELKGPEEVYARESVLLAIYPDTVKLKIQALRVGDLAVVGIPCEVFVEVGQAIKKQSPFRNTFVISLANGYNGYLPTPAQHALGGYETWRARSSYLEVAASDAVTKAAVGVLNQVAAGK